MRDDEVTHNATDKSFERPHTRTSTNDSARIEEVGRHATLMISSNSGDSASERPYKDAPATTSGEPSGGPTTGRISLLANGIDKRHPRSPKDPEVERALKVLQGQVRHLGEHTDSRLDTLSGQVADLMEALQVAGVVARPPEKTSARPSRLIHCQPDVHCVPEVLPGRLSDS